MFIKAYRKLSEKLTKWLSHEPHATDLMPYDFTRLKYEIRPGDVLLIEGRSRISQVIRTLTQSPWTHAALYVGRIIDFEDMSELKSKLEEYTEEVNGTRLIIEDLVDKGTSLTPLSFYKNHHIRICRPIGITPSDIHLVINYAIRSLGQPYNVRHILDLARFLLPWTILPRRWGSSLFRTSSGEPEPGICSSRIAEAFGAVQFPVLPFVKPHPEQGFELFQRNPYLFTPKDFDFSPYFEIIKYPLFNPEEPLPYYRRLPWTKSGFIHQDEGILTDPTVQKKSYNPFKRRKKKKEDEPVTLPTPNEDIKIEENETIDPDLKRNQTRNETAANPFTNTAV